MWARLAGQRRGGRIFQQHIARLAALVHDQRDVIAELDVNPIMCSSRGVIAVDALIVRHPAQGCE
jgi:hypothetical protein